VALLAVAVEAARMAGGLLAERAQQAAERGVASKSTPTDLVSEADFASERAIRELLAVRRPGDGFVGEEGGRAQEGESGLSWIVDPLDGTVNFLFGIPQWCVSVAARDRHGVLAGAIYDPNRDELFTATRGGRAQLDGPSGQIRLAGRDRAVVADAAPAGERDGLASAMIATGLYYDARVREWDVAAGSVICWGAGLEVVELAPHGALPAGILAAPATLATRLLELISEP